MGYTTEFRGTFKTSRPLTEDEIHILKVFNDTRHGGHMNHFADMPGFWCDWTAVSENEIGWDGGEKFYNYSVWLQYLCNHFFKPRGITLTGRVSFRGEDYDDTGCIDMDDDGPYTHYYSGMVGEGDCAHSTELKEGEGRDDERERNTYHAATWHRILSGLPYTEDELRKVSGDCTQ